MAGYSSRSYTYSSGDTILATHTNDEFDNIIAAFNASTGHSHDGTTGEGARILVTDTIGGTQYGIPLLNGAGSQVTSTAAFTAGQLLVGQSTAVPAPKTISGDITIAADGVTTLIVSAVKSVVTDTGTATATANALTIAGGEGIDTSASGTTITVAAEDASATNKGVVELATDAETVTGTDTARAVTPANVTARLAAPGAIGGTTPAAATFTTVTANTSVSTDTISEKTAATGVTVDGVLLKDSEVTTDVINEKTSATGVTVDGVLLKDGSATLTSSDTGATAGPSLILDRDSASPATDDSVGEIVFRGEDSVGNDEDYAKIYAEIKDATSTSEDAQLVFQTKVAGSAINNIRIGNNCLYLNDSDNTKMTRGITINQGSADDEILSFKSSDVAHGLTSQSETDTFASFKKQGAGGLLLDAYGGSQAGLVMRGFSTAAMQTTPATGNGGVVNIYGYLGSGTGVVNSTANGLVFTILTQKGDSGSALLHLDTEGDLHLDGTNSGTFDTWDDAALVRAYDLEFATPDSVIRDRWDEYVQYGRDALVRAGIISNPEPGEGRAMVNVSQLQRLHNGAIWQLHKANMELREQVAKLADGLTRALSMLEDKRNTPLLAPA